MKRFFFFGWKWANLAKCLDISCLGNLLGLYVISCRYTKKKRKTGAMHVTIDPHQKPSTTKTSPTERFFSQQDKDYTKI